MRSQRLLACLLLLQGVRRRTARDLAAALEVSRRTVYRDVEALSQAGVPIHMERGPNGGIVLADDYQRALAEFSGDELRALFASSADPLADLGLATGPHALDKIAGALPPAQRRVVRHTRERLLLDQNRWYRDAQPTELLAHLQRAVAADRRLCLRYRGRDGMTSDRAIDALALVAKAGVWYLVARVAEGEYRSFRAERIVAADDLGTTFVRPKDFDLDAFWRQTIAAIERRPADEYVATLRVRPSALDRLLPFWEATVIAEDGTWTTLRTTFPRRELAAFMVITLGDDARIVEPDDLRAVVVARAAEALAVHGP